MPNMLIVGFSKEDGEKIIAELIRLRPNDMQETVYKTVPEAPVHAISKEPMPYIEIMDSDPKRAERIACAIQDDFVDIIDGTPDVQFIRIGFSPGGGIVPDWGDDR